MLSQQGWLCRAPRSWLLLLIRQLPAKDRLALFQTCRQLAKQTVHSAHSVKLRLAHSYQSQPKEVVQAQREIIRALLEGCASLHVVLHTRIAQFFPTELSSCITEITLNGRGHGKGSKVFSVDWAQLWHLRVVTFVHSVRSTDLSNLCDALEAGQLPGLRSVVWLAYINMDGDSKDVGTVMQQFVAAVVRQVVNLTTNSHKLLVHSGSFGTLESVTLQDGPLKKNAMQQLCNHPTLKHVTLKAQHPDSLYDAFFVRLGDLKCACKWDTITFHGVSPAAIAAIPLEGVKNIKVSYAAPLDNQEGDREGLQQVWAKHADKIVCVPDIYRGGGTFCLTHGQEPELQLVRCLKGVVKLHITHTDVKSLPHLYSALPSCVSCISFRVFEDLSDLMTMWQGLPQHVTSLQIRAWAFEFGNLVPFVMQAPAHVRKLTLSVMSGMRMGPVLDYLSSRAPAHLSVMVKGWK